MAEQKIRTSSGSHWYFPNGKPCHTVPYANGKGERNTNLSDARKLGLLPSVTNILGMVPKPAIRDWVSTHYLKAALECAWDYLFDNSKFWKRWTPQRKAAYQDATFKHARELADTRMELPAKKGTAIHADIEAWLLGVPTVYVDHKVIKGLEKSLGQICKHFNLPPLSELVYETERTLIGPGYAGTADLVIHMSENARVVIDWKSQDTKGYKEPTFWEDYSYQGAAYCEAVGEMDKAEPGLPPPIVHFISVVVSRDNPGLVGWKEWSAEELERGLEIFNAAKNLWYTIKRL